MQRQQECQRTTVQNVRQEARAPDRHLTFHTDHAGMTTADVDQVELAAGYVRFRRRCPKAEVQIGNGRVRSLLDSGSELNLIRERTAQQLDLPISSLPPQITGAMLKTTDGAQSSIIGFIQTPVTIGKVSILTTFVVVEKMSYKIILGDRKSVV